MLLVRRISLIIFLFSGCIGLFGQDSTYVLKSSMFNENGSFRLPDMTEWRFKKGNDPVIKQIGPG